MTFIYSQLFIHHFTVFFRNQHNDQFPSWPDSSVGRALHWYCRGHGLKSRTGLNFFFRPYFHYCSRSVHYCEDRFHIHVFICSSNILLSYIHSRLTMVMLVENLLVVSISLGLEFPFFVFSAAPSTSCTRTFVYEAWICRFSFSAARNAITHATEYVTFGFSFRISVFSPSRKVWMSLSESDTDFSVF